MKYQLTTDTLLLLYYALFYLYLQYCNAVREMVNIISIKPLVLIQKIIIHIIGHISLCEYTNPLFESYNILKITDVYKLINVLEVYT